MKASNVLFNADRLPNLFSWIRRYCFDETCLFDYLSLVDMLSASL